MSADGKVGAGIALMGGTATLLVLVGQGLGWTLSRAQLQVLLILLVGIFVLGLGLVVRAYSSSRWSTIRLHVEPIRTNRQLRLKVTNKSRAADFEAQAVELKGVDGDEASSSWFIRWDGGESRSTILQGQHRFLDVVEFDAKAARSLWSGHAIDDPYRFLEPSGVVRGVYAGLNARSEDEYRNIRLCLTITIYRVAPAAKKTVYLRFGFFGDDAVVNKDQCQPQSADFNRQSAAPALRVHDPDQVRAEVFRLVCTRCQQLTIAQAGSIAELLFSAGIRSVDEPTFGIEDITNAPGPATNARISLAPFDHPGFEMPMARAVLLRGTLLGLMRDINDSPSIQSLRPDILPL